MARFDIFELESTGELLVMEVQSDLLSQLQTTVVIPLVQQKRLKETSLFTLHPQIEIEGQAYILRTAEISAINKAQLSHPIMNLEEQYRDTVMASIDFLISGF